MDKDFEAFIYCDKGIYKSIKILDETADEVRCFIQKEREGFLIKKNPTFSNDFANGKIHTIMGLATLSLRMRKGCFSKNIAFFSVNFPDKHCICVHKCKIRHTYFEICRIFEKLSFRVTL